MTIEQIALEVYKMRLEQDCKGAVKRMLDKDADDGILMLSRSRSYIPVVRAVIRVMTNEARK